MMVDLHLQSSQQNVTVLQGKFTSLYEIVLYPFTVHYQVCLTYRKSASCTHISGLLHALVGLAPAKFQNPNSTDNSSLQLDEPLPITSFECQWKPPRKRKESNLKISDAAFERYIYGREKKRSYKSIAEFDPRPVELRGQTTNLFDSFLKDVKGKGLGVSLLFDVDTRCWSTGASPCLPPVLPSREEIKSKVEEFKKSLQISEQKIREIEQATRDQSQSPLWHSVRRYRITASQFGAIRRRLPTTSPHSLVLQIITPRNFSNPSTEWGKQHEEVALKLYCEEQHRCGHTDLFYSKSGFVISSSHPFLGASPDAVVFDPLSEKQFGLAEVKCPYSCRNITTIEAAEESTFCSSLIEDSAGKQNLQLKRTHPYYSQVQGQMAITERSWCDFIIYTEKNISIERIPFDEAFWLTQLLPKLIDFYDNCLAPEVVCPVHVLGMPVRNLQDV